MCTHIDIERKAHHVDTDSHTRAPSIAPKSPMLTAQVGERHCSEPPVCARCSPAHSPCATRVTTRRRASENVARLHACPRPPFHSTLEQRLLLSTLLPLRVPWRKPGHRHCIRLEKCTSTLPAWICTLPAPPGETASSFPRAACGKWSTHDAPYCLHQEKDVRILSSDTFCVTC